MKIIFLPIVWILDLIIWMFKPRIFKVGSDIDEDFAKHLVIHGGATIITGNSNKIHKWNK